MTRRVDQVELVALPVDPHVLGLDRDTALALEIHRVEVLLAHVTRVDGAGDFEDAIGQRRLAMVDVSDDREVADAGELHGPRRGYQRRSVPNGCAVGPADPPCYPLPARSARQIARRIEDGQWRTSRARRSGFSLQRRPRAQQGGAQRAEDAHEERAGVRRLRRRCRVAAPGPEEDRQARAKGVIHKNAAARRKSRLTKRVTAAG